MIQISPLMHAVEQFDATDANLAKLQTLWSEIEGLIPPGICYGEDPAYDDRRRAFADLLAALPQIDGWKPEIELHDLDAIAQARFDYMEIQEPKGLAQFESELSSPGRLLREYRARFDRMRRQLVRESTIGLIEAIDLLVGKIRTNISDEDPPFTMKGAQWDELRNHVDQIRVLMGSSVPKPIRWSDFQRHLGFGDYQDFKDIERHDWPDVKQSLQAGLYGENDPIPVTAVDLSDLVNAKPTGPVTTKLRWESLDDDSFERLVFNLISSTPGYENPEWLMKTRAPDIGMDLSVTRVVKDALSGTRRWRVVIQCKHWLGRSLSVDDIAPAKDQMTLWRDPPVEVLVIATSGRFTANAVQWIEQHNATTGSSPKIEMWPESHLERLLAERPGLIAEFKLRE